jgi:RNA polymerase primary sigma factor
MGYRFSTYAMWWIRRAVSRAVAFQGQMIRVPVRTGEGRAPSFPSHDHVEQGPLPGRVPVQDHPGSASSEPARKPQQPLSLDGAATDEYGPPLADFLEDRAVLSPVEEAEQQLLHERLVALLGALPTPERLVVELRYGLIDGQPRTLREVGSALGLTRERIRQLEIRALQRLRENDRAGELRAYLQQ